MAHIRGYHGDILNLNGGSRWCCRRKLGDTIQHPVQLLPFLLGDLGGIVLPAPDFEEDSRCGRIYGPGQGR